jgi:hypothetical protein
MRWTVLAVAGMVGMSATVVGLLDASAQQFSTNSTPDVTSNTPIPDAGAPDDAGEHHMLGWAHHSPAPGAWRAVAGLVPTAPDRQLSASDVQTIAQAYLLWHGNHDWRVTNVATDGDRVTFAITTAQNAVVATFAMDRHTGALTRTG